MPAIIATAVRYVIMALIQTAIIWALEKFGLPLIDSAIKKAAETFGATPEQAQDIVGNQVIQFAEQVGITAVALRSKLPIKVAEKLGFTSRGYVRKKLPATIEAKISKTSVPATTKIILSEAEIEQAAVAEATKRGVLPDKVRSVFKTLGKFADKGFLYSLAAANILDFGNWNSGAYQKLMQKVIGVITFGLVTPDIKLDKSSVLSDDVWNRVYATYKEAGAYLISDPYKLQTVFFTRDNLVDLVDKVAAQINLDGGSTSVKNIMEATTAFIAIPGVTVGGTAVTTTTTSSKSGSAATGSVSSSASAKTSTPPADPTSVKVFTGVVSQGTVGGDFLFTPRQDDLIENMGELQAAINNNIAPYLSSLLSQVTYEIKVVSSVVVGGIRRTGTTQRIQSGTYANGSPKYKSVTNKFAVADLFLIRDGGTRTKLTSIVLGPVNALSFNPSSGDLISLAAAVPKNILTSSTNDISTVVSGTPTLVVAPASPTDPDGEPSIGYTFVYDGYLGSVSFNTQTVNRLRREIASGQKTVEQAMDELYRRTYKTTDERGNIVDSEDSWANQNPNVVRMAYQVAPEKIRALLTTGGTFTGTPQQTADESPPQSSTATPQQSAPTKTAAVSQLPPAALSATTLYLFYGAIGQQLPSLEVRGRLYQSYGLGQAAFYTGTAEQNTKLLYSLQGDPF